LSQDFAKIVSVKAVSPTLIEVCLQGPIEDDQLLLTEEVWHFSHDLQCLGVARLDENVFCLITSPQAVDKPYQITVTI